LRRREGGQDYLLIPLDRWTIQKGREKTDDFKYELIGIVRDKLSDLDPGYVEEMEKLRRGMLLAKKGYPGQALSMFLNSKRRKYPEAHEASEEELGR
jgi:hypothetical protein